jgi:hypothetical protein
MHNDIGVNENEDVPGGQSGSFIPCSPGTPNGAVFDHDYLLWCVGRSPYTGQALSDCRGGVGGRHDCRELHWQRG